MHMELFFPGKQMIEFLPIKGGQLFGHIVKKPSKSRLPQVNSLLEHKGSMIFPWTVSIPDIYHDRNPNF